MHNPTNLDPIVNGHSFNQTCKENAIYKMQNSDVSQLSLNLSHLRLILKLPSTIRNMDAAHLSVPLELEELETIITVWVLL